MNADPNQPNNQTAALAAHEEESHMDDNDSINIDAGSVFFAPAGSPLPGAAPIFEEFEPVGWLGTDGYSSAWLTEDDPEPGEVWSVDKILYEQPRVVTLTFHNHDAAGKLYRRVWWGTGRMPRRGRKVYDRIRKAAAKRRRASFRAAQRRAIGAAS